MVFAVWHREQVEVRGETRSWIATTDHRHFCANCGSRLFGTHDDESEVEVRLGALDEAPSDLTPSYELWTPRRERWLGPIEQARQYAGNRATEA